MDQSFQGKSRDQIKDVMRAHVNDADPTLYRKAADALAEYDALHPEEAAAARRRRRRREVRAIREKYQGLLVASRWFFAFMALAFYVLTISVRKKHQALSLESLYPSLIALGLFVITIGIDLWLKFRFTEFPLSVRLIGPTIMAIGGAASAFGILLLVMG